MGKTNSGKIIIIHILLTKLDHVHENKTTFVIIMLKKAVTEFSMRLVSLEDCDRFVV